MANNKPSTWDISTDIYKIVDQVDALRKRFIDEDETTLALGIFGFIGDLEAKKIQSAIIQTGELGNEMFPSRAKLEKNVLTHAIYQNITGINAIPGYCTVTIGIKVSDLNKYMENGTFIFDKECPIYIGNYELHFDYDIILHKTQTANMSKPVYSARYDMDIPNPISDINQPYLKQPVQMIIMNEKYIMFQATMRQVTLEWTRDKMVSASVIDNKTFIFEFDNQLADFMVVISDTNGTYRLTPIFYGSPIPPEVEYYCWYIYINERTIRISFDSSSYIPGLSAEITIEAQTTLGDKGNFQYKQIDENNGAEFVSINSSKYGYSNVNIYILPVTDSTDGKDRKSKSELQQIIPKFALSRGYLTTEKDIDNYFNLINTSTNRLKLQKKVDNQLNRIWYCYFLIKDYYNNIIPTNTVDIKINSLDGSCYISDDNRIIVPAGTYFKYDPNTKLATVIDEADIPEFYTDEYFSNDAYYYLSVFNIAINPNPLYASFYMMNLDVNSFYSFVWVNDDCDVQFIANRNNIKRKLLTDKNIYTFSFNITQSISEDCNLYYEETDIESGETTEVKNIKCLLLLYKGSEPYRWIECNLVDFDETTWTYKWEVNIESDNGLDIHNNIKLLNLKEVGSDATNYGYFEPSVTAYLYILCKFDNDLGRYDLDKFAPGYEGWSVTNKYEVENGIQLFRNYTKMMTTKIRAVSESTFTLTGFPMVGAHYMMNEEYVTFFLNALDDKKAYIDTCLLLLENSMDVDLKLFNTYGPSATYTIGDKKGTSINHVDIETKWRIKLISESDVYTKDAIIQYIKQYIENINDLGDLHFPNLVTELETKFANTIVYVEFMNYNKLWLGIQHMELQTPEDPHIVPEFICIRNTYNKDTNMLEPCIEVECNV